MLGTMVAERNLQAAFWAVDGVGLVVATALLALSFFRTGNDIVAAGFLVFTIGESVMLAGTAESLAGSVPSFAAGTALRSAALLLTSVPRCDDFEIAASAVPRQLLFGWMSFRGKYFSNVDLWFWTQPEPRAECRSGGKRNKARYVHWS